MVVDKVKRDSTIDFVKGLCVLLVIVGHSGVEAGIISKFWYTFYMPAFFIFSGYLFRYKESIKDTILHKTKSLYVLYLIWAIVPYFILFLINTVKHFKISKQYLIVMGKAIVGMELPRLTRQMWFLCTLFTVEMIWILIDKGIKNKKLKVIAIIVLGLIGVTLNFFDINIPVFRLGTALVFLPVFAFGVLLKRNDNNNLVKALTKMNTPLLIVSIFTWLLTSYFHFGVLGYSISASTNGFGMYPLFYFNAILGTLIFWNIGRLLVNVTNRVVKTFTNFFVHFGTNSTIVYVTLQIFVVIYKFIFLSKPVLGILGQSFASWIITLFVIISEIFTIKILSNEKFKFLLAKF